MKKEIDDFSFVNNFSKWIKEENVNKDFNLKKNQKVYPKTIKHLSSKIIVEDGCYKELTKEFIKKGGVIVGSEGNMLLIEVHSGSFLIREKEVYF